MLRDLPLDGEGPAYDQIYRSLRGAILGGRVMPGSRLPASRLLASDLCVSRNTVLAAYDQLLAEGYAVARRGAGTFVAPQLSQTSAGRVAAEPTAGEELPPLDSLSDYGRRLIERRPRRHYEAAVPTEPPRFDFRPCVPDLERLPNAAWRRALSRRALDAPNAAFDYADPTGSADLRRELAAYLGRARGVVCQPDSILIVSGVSQALDLTTRLFLDPGDRVLLEDPGYLGARRVFECAGAQLTAAPVDEQGLDLAAVPPQALADCRLAYVTPSHQFPTGAVMSLARRLELLRWATDSGAFILEDDYDSEFRYEGRAIEALKSLDDTGRVIYVGTFSKTLFPSLRIAYLVLPPGLRELYRDARWLADFTSPALEQSALAAFVASGEFERHTRRARTLYGRSRSALLDALRDQLGKAALLRDSKAGLHVHVRLPGVSHRAFAKLAMRALEREVGLYSAGHCYLEPPDCTELVLGFARLEENEIHEGVARIGEVVRELAS